MQAQSSGGEDISGWVSFDSPTSKLLAEPGNNGDSFTFGFDITPDSSVESGSSVDIRIMAKAGSSVGCEAIVTVKVGQIHAGDISLNTGTISNVEPGSQPQVTISLENTGNGADTFTLNTDPLPPGWSVSFSPPSHSLNAAQTSNNEATSTAVITVPDDALAGSTSIKFKISGGGGPDSLDSVTLTVNVNQRHEVELEFTSTSQNGRTDQIVRFPFVVTNHGNVEDTIKLKFVIPAIKLVVMRLNGVHPTQIRTEMESTRSVWNQANQETYIWMSTWRVRRMPTQPGYWLGRRCSEPMLTLRKP